MIALEIGVPPYLALSVALEENPALVPEMIAGPNRNGTYDFGIMGINSNYMNHFVSEYWDKDWTFNWKNPYDNIYIGIKHLKELLDKPDLNIWQAIIAYNCGYTGFKKGPPGASVDYACRVFERWNFYRKYQ